VAVSIEQPGSMDTFTAGDGFFWLEAGESKSVDVSANNNLTVTAWNVS
jgi:beta-mannosidase